MNKTFKQLFEISEVRAALGRLDELDCLIEVTRSFSLKCNAHIRVITSLVNNLVESDDWLELADSALRLPAARASAAAPLADDFERLTQHVESGRAASTALKSLLERLLHSLPQQRETRHERTRTGVMRRHCHADCPPGCTREHDNAHAHRRSARQSVARRSVFAPREPSGDLEAKVARLVEENAECRRLIAEQRAVIEGGRAQKSDVSDLFTSRVGQFPAEGRRQTAEATQIIGSFVRTDRETIN